MLETLATWLTGDFTNRTQALDDPAWFVHLRLWHQRVELPIPEPAQSTPIVAIFAEQANILNLDQPYRQRLKVLRQVSEQEWHVQYWAFRDPSRVRGAGQTSTLLNDITWADLIELPGCQLWVIFQDQEFIATPKPELKCCFEYAGETRQVELGFRCRHQHFTSYDRGVDMQTGKPLWGAMMGPYEFDKVLG